MTDTVGYGVKIPRTRGTRGILYLRGLPKTVKQNFKAVVVRRGDTMERVVSELMRKYVEDPECIERWERKRKKKEVKK